MAELCTATAKSTGNRCGRPAVSGAVVCRHHGGAARQVRAAAAERVFEEEVRRAIGQLDVHPLEDPLTALTQLAGEVVAWKTALGRLVADLRTLRYDSEGYGEQVRGEVLLFERALDRCGKVLGLIARLDLDARLARITEQQADAMIEALQAGLAAAGVTGEQAGQARRVAASHLRVVNEAASA